MTTLRSFTIDAGCVAASVISLLDINLKNGWHRDITKENLTQAIGTSPMYFFSCQATERYPAASICLTETQDGKLYVNSVVAEDGTKLSPTEYNYVTEDFYNQFVLPLVGMTSLPFEMVGTPCSLEELVSRELLDQLSMFSLVANKSIVLDQFDQRRWQDFVIATHQKNIELTSSILKSWLVKNGWSDEVASKLAEQYASERELLTHYDRAKSDSPDYRSTYAY